MTDEVNKRWMFNIYLELKELSDIEFQKKAWFAQVPNYVSDFGELYNSLFDDFNFDLFVDDKMPNISVSENFIDEIRKLRDSMNLYLNKYLKKYKHKHVSDKVVLEDPEWHKISDQAKIVRDYWERELGVPQQPE